MATMTAQAPTVWWRKADPCSAPARHGRTISQNAPTHKAVMSTARGTPNSTAHCSTKLWVWSKKATGRAGKGVIDHAKLKRP